jgi:hypothetical protein
MMELLGEWNRLVVAKKVANLLVLTMGFRVVVVSVSNDTGLRPLLSRGDSTFARTRSLDSGPSSTLKPFLISALVQIPIARST